MPSSAWPSSTPAAAPAPHATAGARFVVLDGLRGVGAIMVLILHSTMWFRSINLVVDLFFMLSGFVLAHGYGARLRNAEERERFVIARLIRVWPLYMLGCAIALGPTLGMAIYGYSFWTIGVWIEAVLTAPFFMILSYDVFSIPLNPPGWSLSFELLANAAFVVTGTRLRPALAIVAAAGAGLLWFLSGYHGGKTGWLSFWACFPRVFFSFYGGVLLYRLWQWRRLVPPTVPALLLLLAVVLYCVVEPPMVRAYYAAILFIGNPLIIYLAAHALAHGRTASLCKVLGDLSFALYAIHVPVIMIVEGLKFLLTGANVASYSVLGGTWPISQPLSLGLAWIATYHWDFAVRRSLMRRFLPRPAPA